MFKSYTDVRAWLESFIPQTYTKENLGLARIKYLLQLIGNPQDKFKSIHVAGTSGKGSTAFYIASLLQRVKESKSQRVKVGLHVSPHLTYIGERMQINGEPIPVELLIRLISQIRPIVKSMSDSKVGLPSYFEILVASTFLYFAQERVDWAVVEVGLGGRFDATNVLKPKICVITNVGLDHTDILGKTIEEIAFEKAGIVKRGTSVVTGASGKVWRLIEKVATAKKARLIKFNIQSLKNPQNLDGFRNVKIPFDIKSHSLNTFASQNFLLALITVNSLGIQINNRIIRKSLKEQFLGRFEEIDKNIILDGAHNPDKIQALIEFIGKSKINSQKSKIILIMAFKKGKDWKKMVDLLIKNLPVSKAIATKFYAVTDMGKNQTVEPKEIAKYVRSVYSLQTTVYGNSHEAVFSALTSNSYSTNQLFLVTGSLYLVGEVRTIWQLPAY